MVKRMNELDKHWMEKKTELNEMKGLLKQIGCFTKIKHSPQIVKLGYTFKQDPQDHDGSNDDLGLTVTLDLDQVGEMDPSLWTFCIDIETEHIIEEKTIIRELKYPIKAIKDHFTFTLNIHTKKIAFSLQLMHEKINCFKYLKDGNIFNPLHLKYTHVPIFVFLTQTPRNTREIQDTGPTDEHICKLCLRFDLSDDFNENVKKLWEQLFKKEMESTLKMSLFYFHHPISIILKPFKPLNSKLYHIIIKTDDLCLTSLLRRSIILAIGVSKEIYH